jgi:hypothetical protein
MCRGRFALYSRASIIEAADPCNWRRPRGPTMTNVVNPDPEGARLAVLRRYNILDTAEELAFDDLTFLAATFCRVPVAALTFLDVDRVWVKSQIGLYITDLPRDITFCYALMRAGSMLVVPDLREDPRFCDHPLVTRFPNLRFYAGIPLVTQDDFFLGALEVMDWEPHDLDDQQMEALQVFGRQAMAQLDLRAVRSDHTLLVNAMGQAAQTEDSAAYDELLEGIGRALDRRDGHEKGHLHHLADLTVRLAGVMGIPDHALPHIRRGALLHDIGKLAIPDRLLLKPGGLTDDEWQIIRLHPVYAYEILRPIEILHPAIDIPYCHHERWDGNGYPRGLKGDAIPLVARVFAVVDVWDALQADRPYREGWSVEQVRDYLRSRAGTWFDPRVVEAFLKMGL